MLDCPLFATNPPFDPKSSRVPFPECLYTKHFPKHALLDLLRSLMTGGKVNQNRRNSRHFPGRERLQVQRERSVEPIPQPTSGESEPESQEFPALSLGVEMPSVAREACGAGTPVGHGGK